MADTAGNTASASVGVRVARGLWRFLLGLIKRAYALALIALILWLSWKAFEYLVVSLILPTPTPPQIADVPARLDRSVLDRGPRAFAGIAATDTPRLPPSQYHRFDTWFVPDTFNDCTRSGCHAPLPHNRRKEDRAFLNMHATSMHCGVCHLDPGKGRPPGSPDSTPLALTWYSVETGRAGDPPPLLAAYAWLLDFASKTAAVPTAEDQRTIVRLLRSAARAAGDEPSLRNVAEHLAAVRHTSDEFRHFLLVAQQVVPRHFRGEYGSKLALRDPQTGRPVLEHPGTRTHVEAFLEAGDTLPAAQRETLLERIHPLRRAETLTCTDCHRPADSLIDFAALGYPPTRIEALHRPLVMQTIEHIMQGRPFYMPEFMPRTKDNEE